MTHGSLFSGMGGFDLAAEWMGWENVFHCEWNPFGQKILKHYWPNAISYDDICKTDFTIWRGRIDILTGGFPCQPYSMAGKRKGTEDSRHLWPEMLRAIRECRPTWIVGENVPGLINWSGGMVFEQVCAELEGEGYEVQPIVLPASGVNAPHRRDRVWFVAYRNAEQREYAEGGFQPEFIERTTQNPNGDGCGSIERADNDEIGVTAYGQGKQSERMRPEQREISEQEQREFGRSDSENVTSDTGLFGQKERQERPMGIEQLRTERDASDTISSGRKKRNIPGEPIGTGFSSRARNAHRTDWQGFPTQSPILSGNDGLSSDLDGITFPKWRNESIKAAGNAIVPQIALQIFKTIQAMNNNI